MLLNWWKRRHVNNLMGLDIGSDDIKLLKINSTETPNIVENFAIAPLPKGAVVQNEIKKPNEIIAVLKELCNQPEIKTKNVALAIPRSSVIIKNVMVDSRLTAAEIESRAWVEANRLFPDLVGEIYLDFHVIGASSQDPTQLEVILVASRKDQINLYLDVLHRSGLTPKVIDVNCYALERALASVTQQFSPLGQIKTQALLNIDYTLSTLIVVDEGHLIYAHDQSYDGYRLMAKIHEYLSSRTEESIQQHKSSIDDPDYLQILTDNLSTHLRHAMHFLYSSRPNLSIQQLVLAGDCAIVPNLAAFIQKEVSIETAVADPFVNMKIGEGLNEIKLKQYTPTLMLCCGLALSTFNKEEWI